MLKKIIRMGLPWAVALGLVLPLISVLAHPTPVPEPQKAEKSKKKAEKSKRKGKSERSKAEQPKAQ
jgi:hypothetical protein